MMSVQKIAYRLGILTRQRELTRYLDPQPSQLEYAVAAFLRPLLSRMRRRP